MLDRVNPRYKQPRQTWMEYFYIYVLIISTGGFTFFMAGFHPSEMPSKEPASYLGRASTLAVSLIILLIYLRNYRVVNAAIRASWPLFLFSLLAFLSCLWSDDSAVTFRRAYALTFSFLAAACLVALLSPVQVVRALCLALGWAMLLSVVYVIFLPGYGIHQPSDWVAPFWAGHWRGIYTHKNTLGNTASVALMMFMVFSKYVVRSTTFRGATLIAVAACLFGAASVTGVVVASIMIGVAIAFKILIDAPREARVVILGGASLLTAVVIATAIPMFAIALELLGKQPDLTGRVPIWSTLIIWAQDRPWLGYGFASFEEAMLPRFQALTGEPLVNAHNGYLEIFISFGYTGLANLVIVLVFFVRNVIKALKHPIPYEKLVLPVAFSLFIGSLCSNITESFFLAYSSIQHMSFSIAYMMIAVPLSRATAANPFPKHSSHMQRPRLGIPSPVLGRSARAAGTL